MSGSSAAALAAAAAGATEAAKPPKQTVVVRREAPGEEWDRYVHSRPDASIYHLRAWADVTERAFGHRTRSFTARADGRIVGVLPMVVFNTPLFGRFVTSMPFVNYGGVVADDAEIASQLVDAAIDEARTLKASYLELRHTERRLARLDVQTHKVSMLLPLESTADLQWQALDRKVRNQVRKGEKSGLTAASGGVELLDAFHDVLAENMRDLGSPVHSKRFYRHILESFPDRSRIFCVSAGDTPAAASFVVWHNDQMEVPWASARRRFNPLCANVFLYWEMLKFGIERGFATFDFGRSTPHEGTYQFKAQWGALPRQLYWEYWLAPGVALPDRSPKNKKFSAAISLWQRLPVAITKTAGPLIVRNIP